MSPARIHGTEKVVSKIFCDDFVFQVPNYQRPYAWTPEEAGELLEDLIISMQDQEGNDNGSNPYFLGSIVLIKNENEPDALIVDGQQRLVTLTILFSVIRTLVKTTHAEDITKRIYEKGDTILGTQNRYRLTVRKRDKDFFREYIQNEGGIRVLEGMEDNLPDSCKNMRDNALHFLKRLKVLNENERLSLVKHISLHCYIVAVSTPDLDSAYRIFSVLNDRGMDLSLTDILKAEIIGKIGKVEEDRYTEKWEDIENQLGREAFEDMFAHLRMISAKKKVRSSVLQEFRTFVNPTENPVEFIDKILLPMGELFDQIRNASFEGTSRVDKINKYLTYLNRIDNFDWQPSAILFSTSNRNDTKILLRFLKKLERLATGMMIIRADINYRLERYGRLLAAIEEKDKLFDDDSPLQLTRREQGNIISELNGELYKVVKIRLPVLLRLDEALSEGEASYDFPIISVEHVLPQTPPDDSKWLEWWDDEEKRAKTLHRIGNLALLSRRKNSLAKNYEFEKKKKAYFQHKGVCPFALTTQVLNETEWTPEVVEERQAQLVNKLKEVWDLRKPKLRRRSIS